MFFKKINSDYFFSKKSNKKNNNNSGEFVDYEELD